MGFYVFISSTIRLTHPLWSGANHPTLFPTKSMSNFYIFFMFFSISNCWWFLREGGRQITKISHLLWAAGFSARLWRIQVFLAAKQKSCPHPRTTHSLPGGRTMQSTNTYVERFPHPDQRPSTSAFLSFDHHANHILRKDLLPKPSVRYYYSLT